MLLFIVIVVIAIILATFIFFLKEDRGGHGLPSEDLLEKIKRTDLVVHKFRIRGIAFLSEESRKLVFNLEEGEILYLRREPWNFSDPNAVAVLKDEIKVGYIEKPLNKVILNQIKNNYKYQCRYQGKSVNEKGYKEYFCTVVIANDWGNDRIPIGFTDPRKDNIYTNPRLKFPLGKQNYDFYEVPGEWIPCDWSLYEKETRYEVEDDPDLKEFYDDNCILMRTYLRELYNKDFMTPEDVIEYFKFERSDKFITKNKVFGAMVLSYIKSHEIDL